MSQVAEAIGLTTAPPGPGTGGAGIERQATRPPGEATSERIIRCLRSSLTTLPASTALERRRRLPLSRSSDSRVAASESGKSIPV
jgi:hypothetical protein